MTWRLALALLPLIGCVATRRESPLVVAADAGAPSAAEVAPAETTADAGAEAPVTFHCVIDTYYCEQYTGLPEPAGCGREEGPCGPPADPATDICVVSPGHLVYYYHLEIPVDGGSIPYGPLPPANCVHP
jgi:hypothetical protein